MNALLYYILEAWNVWSMLFSPLPFGDPYIAGVTLFSLVFYGMWRKAFGPSRVL